MLPRPAGMSDEDSSDDDYYYSKPKINFVHKQSQMEDLVDYSFLQNHDEEKNLEIHVIDACIQGDLNILEQYCKKHDINKFVHNGWSLLLYATSSVQLEVIQYLLEHDANPNMHNDGFTPLMALCGSQKGSRETSLNCLVLLIEAGADVNATNKYGDTVLMYACKSQNVDFVDELLKHVKNINASGSSGNTALSYAVLHNKADIVATLLEHNADPTLPDRNNLTPKQIADIKDFTEISAMLAPKTENKTSYCEISQITTWRDSFPELNPRSKELLDHNISYILYGMGLERYDILFQGMDLKTFLQLTEDDICCFGIDLTVYREYFLENLHRFHCKKWKVDSIGIVKKSVPYTIFDGTLTLANIKLQIGVIGSSFQYIKNNLIRCADKDIHFNPAERAEYEEELKKTKNILKALKDEVNHFKKLAQEIDKEDGIGVPAHFLASPKKNRNKTIWVVPLSVTLIIGLYIYKTTYIH